MQGEETTVRAAEVQAIVNQEVKKEERRGMRNTRKANTLRKIRSTTSITGREVDPDLIKIVIIK